MTTHKDLIISVSGIRGKIGEGLSPEVASAFASAMGAYTKGGTIVLSRDGRPSGQMLRHAILGGLLASGCEVRDVGVAPTPTVGYAVQKIQAAGAIQITASHNPSPWNGLKLFGSDGRVLTATEGEQLKQMFESQTFRHVPWNDVGYITETPQALDWHRQRVLELVDVTLIRSRQLRAFLDANGGAGGSLGPDLLDALGCKPVAIGTHCDGNFEHEPEPTAENLVDVCPKVVEAGANIGFVLDPDADRLALLDEKGNYIGEELTLALAVMYRLRQQAGPVVVNMSTSRVTEDICQRFNVECHRSAVGEANVCDMMKEVGAVIGGEGNGGVIDPRVGFVRDPFIGMGLVLSLLAEEDKPLSEIVATLPSYSIVKTKCEVDRSRLPEIFEKLQKTFSDARPNTVDGLRLDWEDRWLHVRPSNTEPIVRIIAEAPQTEEAKELCQKAGQVL